MPSPGPYTLVRGIAEEELFLEDLFHALIFVDIVPTPGYLSATL
jgi:hypothetical protein